MKNYELSQLTFGTLFNHFYESHDTVLVTENSVLIGAITYNSFVSSENISDIIRKAIVIDSEDEMEIGDLVNVYILRDGNSFREVSKKVDPRYAFTIDRFKDLYNDNDIIANYVKSLDLDTIFVIGDNRNYIYAFLNMYGLKANIMNVDEKYLPYLLNSSFPNSIVIDTSGFNTELLQKLGRRQNLEQRIIDLKE